jgi:hypothetical protein
VLSTVVCRSHASADGQLPVKVDQGGIGWGAVRRDPAGSGGRSDGGGHV